MFVLANLTSFVLLLLTGLMTLLGVTQRRAGLIRTRTVLLAGLFTAVSGVPLLLDGASVGHEVAQAFGMAGFVLVIYVFDLDRSRHRPRLTRSAGQSVTNSTVAGPVVQIGHAAGDVKI